MFPRRLVTCRTIHPKVEAVVAFVTSTSWKRLSSTSLGPTEFVWPVDGDRFPFKDFRSTSERDDDKTSAPAIGRGSPRNPMPRLRSRRRDGTKRDLVGTAAGAAVGHPAASVLHCVGLADAGHALPRAACAYRRCDRSVHPVMRSRDGSVQLAERGRALQYQPPSRYPPCLIVRRKCLRRRKLLPS